MIKSHQIQLNPTKSQTVLLQKSCGVARHSFNWALEVWQKQYRRGKKPSAYTLIKLQNSIKKKVMPFYLEVNKCAVQYAIHNLENSYKKMWNQGNGYPKFKKKGSKDSYVALENSKSFKQNNSKIWLPRIGWVKCYENLRFEGKVNNVVVKRIADKWFAVVNVDTYNQSPTKSENKAIIGVDMGILNMMFASDGTIYDNPKAYKKAQKSLIRCQKKLSKKVRGSNNSKKQQILLAKKHYRIKCIRSNAIHQATTDLVRKAKTIVIEDLDVKGMFKNKYLSKSLTDVSFGEIKRQLVYKCKWYGVELIFAERFYPSSKLCYNCGHKKEVLKLNERVYNCSNCNISIDRDFNASKNLASLGTTHSTSGSKACGEVSSTVEIQCSTFENHEINHLN